MMMFATLLKNARHAAGLTQKSMSELFEIPQRTIEAWESSDRIPPVWAQRLILNELTRIQNDNINNSGAKTDSV